MVFWHLFDLWRIVEHWDFPINNRLLHLGHVIAVSCPPPSHLVDISRRWNSQSPNRLDTCEHVKLMEEKHLRTTELWKTCSHVVGTMTHVFPMNTPLFWPFILTPWSLQAVDVPVWSFCLCTDPGKSQFEFQVCNDNLSCWSSKTLSKTITHMLHVWNIYLHDCVMITANVGTYSIHGASGLEHVKTMTYHLAISHSHGTSLQDGGLHGKMIYKWAMHIMAMLNNQRVYVISISLIWFFNDKFMMMTLWSFSGSMFQLYLIQLSRLQKL